MHAICVEKNVGIYFAALQITILNFASAPCFAMFTHPVVSFECIAMHFCWFLQERSPNLESNR